MAHYSGALPLLKGKSVLVLLSDIKDSDAFFSCAPLSRAADNAEADFEMWVSDGKSESMPVMEKTWGLFEKAKAGEKAGGAKELREFIAEVDKKAKVKGFSAIFRRPEIILCAEKNGFSWNGKKIAFKPGWFKEYRGRELLETCGRILQSGFALKKGEKFSIGFECIPSAKRLELPLEDYLDNFAMAHAMALKAKALGAKPGLAAGTNRKTQLEPLVACADLKTTLAGCEYSKNIGEPVFRKFRRLSQFIGSQRLKPSDASFGIHGKGYPGKHFFGTYVGYPTPNRKSRWSAPGQMFLKPWWNVQTRHDTRMPKTRYAITETLPIDNFIRTCNISYAQMHKKNLFIKSVLDASSKIFVRGREINGVKTDLVVDMDSVRKANVIIWESDSDVTSKIFKEAFRRFGVRAGEFANFPGGETFFTPYKMDGTFVGDEIINIDQSYRIPKSNPLVVQVKNGRYAMLKGDRVLLQKFEKRKKDALKVLGEKAKHKSLPAEVVKSMRQNFDRVGEFAINTNPKAGHGRYLIEMEKMANMMHIALGSGFEPKRETVYHCDIVINAPRQKMDIFGVDKEGRKRFILRNGKFVV